MIDIKMKDGAKQRYGLNNLNIRNISNGDDSYDQPSFNRTLAVFYHSLIPFVPDIIKNLSNPHNVYLTYAETYYNKHTFLYEESKTFDELSTVLDRDLSNEKERND